MAKTKDSAFIARIQESATSGIRDCDLLIGRYVNPTLRATLKKLNIACLGVDEEDGDEAVAKHIQGTLADKSSCFPCETLHCRSSCLGA